MGNNRGGPRSIYTYLLAFNLNDSVLNARTFSQTGQETAKPQYNNYTINGLIGGPLRIPHILKNGPNFNVQYHWSRARQRTGDALALFPTQAQRNGDLSSVTSPIIDPTTGLPFVGNIIPSYRISPCQAQALLSYYPLRQLHLVAIQLPDSDRGHLAWRFRQHPDEPAARPEEFDPGKVRVSEHAGKHSKRIRLSLSGHQQRPGYKYQSHMAASVYATDELLRSSTRSIATLAHAYSFFENRTNVSGIAGITGNLQSPTYFGPPGLSFGSSGIFRAGAMATPPSTGLHRRRLRSTTPGITDGTR